PWRSFDRWKDAASKGEWAPARPRCLPTSRARLAHRELVGQRARHVRAGALTRLAVAFRQQLLTGRDERYARDAELFSQESGRGHLLPASEPAPQDRIAKSVIDLPM